MINKRTGITLVAMALYTSISYAETSEPSIYSFSGFGTLGMVHSNADKADFIGGVSQPNGAGYSHEWSADVDSKVGVQMNANFTDQLSGVVQVVSEHRYDNRYTPQVEWANLKYQVTHDFDVRLGRTVDNLYMQSDIRLVGYAYPWLRRPREIYGLIPVNHKDGADATYRFQIGEAANTLQVSYGKTTLKIPNGRVVEVRKIFTFSDSVEYGAATVRVGYTSLKADFHSVNRDLVINSLLQFGTSLAAVPSPSFQAASAQAFALANKYDFVNDPYSVITAGASYDPGSWLIQAEWAKTPTSPALVPRSTAWYIAGGYRIDKFTPYLMLASVTAKQFSEPGISTVGLPPPLAATAARLNGGLTAAISSFTFTQKTFSAGVRWDLMKDIDLKFQYDRLKTGTGSTGLLGNIQPGFQSGQKINVYSATMDFVF